ncbi:hypothetical protein [Sphingomonas pokkalii]|uniref:hypothetical protein n=1 Tax=Sphingomonas pokkalii TaxID=2175090 RepID=UPI0014028733|nr:hypothetical protein [Sphingomonas pokkalii]
MATPHRVSAPCQGDGVAAALGNAFGDDANLPQDMLALLAKLDDRDSRNGW